MLDLHSDNASVSAYENRGNVSPIPPPLRKGGDQSQSTECETIADLLHTYHLSLVVTRSHLSLVTCHLSLVSCQLSVVTRHSSPSLVTGHSSLVTPRPLLPLRRIRLNL